MIGKAFLRQLTHDLFVKSRGRLRNATAKLISVAKLLERLEKDRCASADFFVYCLVHKKIKEPKNDLL